MNEILFYEISDLSILIARIFATNSTLLAENQPRPRLFQFRDIFVLTESGETRMIVSYLEWDMSYEMEDEAGCRGPSGGEGGIPCQ